MEECLAYDYRNKRSDLKKSRKKLTAVQRGLGLTLVIQGATSEVAESGGEAQRPARWSGPRYHGERR